MFVLAGQGRIVARQGTHSKAGAEARAPCMHPEQRQPITGADTLRCTWYQPVMCGSAAMEMTCATPIGPPTYATCKAIM